MSELKLRPPYFGLLRDRTFPQALKRSDATGFMSEPFEAQDELKLRPPYLDFFSKLSQSGASAGAFQRSGGQLWGDGYPDCIGFDHRRTLRVGGLNADEIFAGGAQVIQLTDIDLMHHSLPVLQGDAGTATY